MNQINLVTSTTALEGSTLSDAENTLLLEKGVSSFGKTFAEQLLNMDVNKAYDLAMYLADNHEFVSVYRLRQISTLAMENSPYNGNTVTREPELNRLCGTANEARRHIGTMTKEQLYKTSFELHFGISRIKPWAGYNDLMGRLLMHQFQREAGLEPTHIGPSRAEEYKRILKIALEEDIAEIFVTYMMAHIGDKVQLYQSKPVAGVAGGVIRVDNSAGAATIEVEPAYTPRVRGSSRARILELLRKHPFMSAVDLAERMGISDKAVEKQISILKKTDALRRVGPDKGGRWVVTDKAYV